MTSTP
jgi:hypothetical protein